MSKIIIVKYGSKTFYNTKKAQLNIVVIKLDADTSIKTIGVVWPMQEIHSVHLCYVRINDDVSPYVKVALRMFSLKNDKGVGFGLLYLKGYT